MILAIHEVHESLPEVEKANFLFEQVFRFATDLGLFKNPGFSEEKEVRLIRAVNVVKGKTSWSLKDVGGEGEKISGESLPISYRASANGGVVAYVELPLQGLGPNLIKKVIIGPKNPCNGNEISMALAACGLEDVSVVRSKSTYR